MEQSEFIALAVALTALVGFSIGVFVLRRVSDQPLLWWWSAWSALIAAGVLASVNPEPGASVSTLALSPLFSFFTLFSHNALH